MDEYKNMVSKRGKWKKGTLVIYDYLGVSLAVYYLSCDERKLHGGVKFRDGAPYSHYNNTAMKGEKPVVPPPFGIGS